MPSEEDAEAHSRALLKSELSKETHDYLSRGRSFASASDEQLRSEWVVAVRRWMLLATRSMLEIWTILLQRCAYETSKRRTMKSARS
jgi:hypothetical protein